MDTLNKLQEYITKNDISKTNTPIGIRITSGGKFQVLMTLTDPFCVKDTLPEVLLWIEMWLNKNQPKKQIDYGGMFRCCVETVEKYPYNVPEEGTVIDCLYEKEGNGQIIFKDGKFRWNQEK
jgi:hypothetical protein